MNQITVSCIQWKRIHKTYGMPDDVRSICHNLSCRESIRYTQWNRVESNGVSPQYSRIACECMTSTHQLYTSCTDTLSMRWVAIEHHGNRYPTTSAERIGRVRRANYGRFSSCAR